MVLLQPKLNLKVSQKQILTPGLVQMVSVLALNKLELTDMIKAELTENPVLEELDDSVPLLDEVSAREERLERESATPSGRSSPVPARKKIPSRKSISDRSFTNIWIRACVLRSRWRTARSPPLRTFLQADHSDRTT